MLLTHGSLFTGIGGFDIGFERAGIRTLWQVEKDEYCRQVLAQHWPEVQRFDDICTVGGHDLRPVDVISGGFPCQDISSAGKGAGLDGSRSGLWYEMLRVIGELRPHWAVIENVPALRLRGSDVVLAGLEGQGYTCWPFVVGAWAVGAPHKRDRVWIVAHDSQHGCGQGRQGRLDSGGERESEFALPMADSPTPRLPDGCRPSLGQSGEVTQPERCSGTPRRLSHDSNSDSESPGWTAESRRECNQWATEPNVGRVAHGIPSRVDRLRALGNAVVPQIPEIIARAILHAEGVTNGCC